MLPTFEICENNDTEVNPLHIDQALVTVYANYNLLHDDRDM